MFVFRNYTIENLFDEGVQFSGYGDISEIPSSDGYVWFYNVPVAGDTISRLNEVANIPQKLRYVLGQIPMSIPVYIVSLENLYPIKICDSESDLEVAIAKVNDEYWKASSEHPNVYVISFADFLREHAYPTWTNWKFYFLSQMIVSPTLAPDFKKWWKSKINEFSSPRKKCIVLDLDNTLWSGVLGEDGASGIKMSGDYPGNAFQYFQENLIELADSGVILTVCSKNNEEDVISLWNNNPFVKLGPKYISAYRINWNNKADNIREIAKELNIGLDSMVFVDDNPTERELIRQQLPMVDVPEFPKRPYELMDFYASLVERYFRAYRLTKEDLAKTEQYKANARRASEQSKYTDLSDFIRSLENKIDIQKANEFNIPRIAQMTQKTNQFNLTTHRYTEADINALISEGADVYCISVADKFGDNGITGEIIVKRTGKEAEIDTFLLSCRILGKDIEKAFIFSILNKLQAEGIKSVKAKFIPTAKNSQVADFYSKVGFDFVEENDGVKKYQLAADGIFAIPNYYTINFK